MLTSSSFVNQPITKNDNIPLSKISNLNWNRVYPIRDLPKYAFRKTKLDRNNRRFCTETDLLSLGHLNKFIKK